MTTPTPAAVRAAFKPVVKRTDADADAIINSRRMVAEILRDHIRSIAAEMRAVIPHGSKVTLSEAVHASVLNSFADKLEGKQ